MNQKMPLAFEKLGYTAEDRRAILENFEQEETIEGAPYLREGDLKVFDCAFKSLKGHRTIEPMGHIKMMAALTPFPSGGRSKTVILPNEGTVEDTHEIYALAWKLGLKAIAIYRNGCRRVQPLNTSAVTEGEEAGFISSEEEVQPRRARQVTSAKRYLISLPLLDMKGTLPLVGTTTGCPA